MAEHKTVSDLSGRLASPTAGLSRRLAGMARGGPAPRPTSEAVALIAAGLLELAAAIDIEASNAKVSDIEASD